MSDEKKGISLENQKIQKMGTYHYISIPKAFIDNKLLIPGKKYKVILIENAEGSAADSIESNTKPEKVAS